MLQHCFCFCCAWHDLLTRVLLLISLKHKNKSVLFHSIFFLLSFYSSLSILFHIYIYSAIPTPSFSFFPIILFFHTLIQPSSFWQLFFPLTPYSFYSLYSIILLLIFPLILIYQPVLLHSLFLSLAPLQAFSSLLIRSITLSYSSSSNYYLPPSLLPLALSTSADPCYPPLPLTNMGQFFLQQNANCFREPQIIYLNTILCRGQSLSWVRSHLL